MPPDDPLDRLARGEQPANIALMQALWDSGSQAAAEARVRAALDACQDHDAAGRLAEALALLRAHPDAFTLVDEVLRRVEDPPPGEAPDAAIARYAVGFDKAAALSPEAGVALYSLGDPALLAACTAEVVERMRDWDLLGPDRRVLEVGCGAGRFLAALAPEVAHVTGAEISPGMATVARERTAYLANVEVIETGGRDLGFMVGESVDLVLFADSFPYLVEAGGDVPARHLAESARVLRPRGRVLILNFSYRSPPEEHRGEVEALADTAGLKLVRASTADFKLWDGAVWMLTAKN